MAGSAAHLVDCVLPSAPVRQYVLAFPYELSGLAAIGRYLGRLAEAAEGRIVNVSSGNHYKAKAIPWDHLSEATRSYTGLPEYAVSKQCNVLFTAELRRRHPRITSVSMNPGPIASDIFRRMPAPLFAMLKLVHPMASVDVGGARLKHAATVPVSGDDASLYIDRDAPRGVNPIGLREDLATELWDFSLRATAA